MPGEAHRQVELALTQARYEANLARRQYDAVDPDNRLVAGELERRWNDCLVEVRRLEERLAEIGTTRPDVVSPTEQERLLALGADLETVWRHPRATAEMRKRILRTAIAEIVATLADSAIELVVHWQGGDHTRLSVPRNRTGQHRWRCDAAVDDMIRELARQQSDQAIAATLNRARVQTGRGNTWTQARVCSFRSAHGIAVHRPGEMAERGELTLEEAADRLGVSKMTVLRLIGSGAITARQVCKGAPWAIPAAQLEALDPRMPSARPITAIPGQTTLEFQ
jgi:excisionase family DNA binding protein